MKHKITRAIPTFLSIICVTSPNVSALAQDAPFKITDGLFDAAQKETMGLNYAPEAETFTIWKAAESGNHYANGVVLTSFKGNLYCMWQTSATDEDAADTYVAYSRSTDGGQTWSAPMTLCATIDNGYCASGGWISTDDLLVGFINVRTDEIANSGGYTQYVESADGQTWSAPKDVLMSDGNALNGIFEQDPHKAENGRVIGAAHFQPGLLLSPIYTDDATGRTGWKKATFDFTANGAQSVELEPSFFRQNDGTWVMTMRDQKGSYTVLAATSNDNGETWTNSTGTNMPDSRAKQSAGNLSDGTAYIVNNPGRVTNSSSKTWRVPLAITLSADGKTFDHAYMLRSGQSDDYPELQYTGKAKTLGYSYPKSMAHDGYLYVGYSTNKEAVQYTRIPLGGIALGIETTAFADTRHDDVARNLLGQRVKCSYKGFVVQNGRTILKK
ncbi:MAG: exo-alpha-sialidase [Bacteroidales bacterium]|nr:exo-alpha-sialidase [Bacteroidales bacterium]